MRNAVDSYLAASPRGGILTATIFHLFPMVSIELGNSNEDKANWKAPKKETSPTVAAAKEAATQADAESRAFQQMEADMLHENDGARLTEEKVAEFGAVSSAKHEAMRSAERATDDASLLEGLEHGGKGMWPHEMVKAASLAIEAGDTELLVKAEKNLAWQVPARVEERLRDEFHSRETVRTLVDVIRLGEENPAFSEEAKVAKALIEAKMPQG